MNISNPGFGRSLSLAFEAAERMTERMMTCACCALADFRIQDGPFINAERLYVSCPLDNQRSVFKKPMLQPEHQPSHLQKLPIEVYHNCLQFLDVATLTSMRGVSQYTRASIDSLHPYKELYHFARSALRACLSTEMASHIPLLHLHHALTTMECYYCKHSETPESVFGAYLSLFEGCRICAFCARNSPLLKPLELSHLMNLCSSRKPAVSAPSISTIPRLKTLPGRYSLPVPNAVQPRIPRTVLLLTHSIPVNSGRSLTDKELRLLSASTNRGVMTLHHPFVLPANESDISPSVGYTSPETSRIISLRFASIIAFPYIAPTKLRHDGFMCKECTLRMRYLERCWKDEQQRRRVHGGSPVASTRRRDEINEARKMASSFYILDVGGDEKLGSEFSIREHYRVEHGQDWRVGKGEKAWRKRHFGLPTLPSLQYGNFWEPRPVSG